MMIERKLKPIGFIAVALMAVVAVTQSAYCQEKESYCLMIQQSSVDAGFVNPGIGIHRIPIGEHVSLTAIPKPGYRFVYWMGNVSDASAREAIVVMDAPKIIVAVFERDENELIIATASFASGMGGGGGLVGVGGGVRGGGPVSAGGPVRSPRKRTPFDWTDPPDVDEGDPIPVPEDNSIPVPKVPEPATVVILGAGGLMLFRRKKR